MVYCVSVPNTTLYVRRNSKVCWCGNSVQEHCNFTFVNDSYKHEAQREIMLSCLNRPGVYVNKVGKEIRITANVRSIKEWYLWNNNIVNDSVHNMLGYFLRREARKYVPFALKEVNKELEELNVDSDHFKIVFDKVDPNERWITILVSGVSRNLSHEQVRHKFSTAVSQRSTRYVDESDTEFEWHPLLNKYETKDKNLGIDILKLEVSSRDIYTRTYNYLEECLSKDGIDKFTAKKQARGAARGALLTCLGTEFVFSATIAQWKRMLSQRMSDAADAEIRLMYNLILEKLQDEIKIDMKDSQDKIGKVLI
jgi:hypothetical protein